MDQKDQILEKKILYLYQNTTCPTADLQSSATFYCKRYPHSEKSGCSAVTDTFIWAKYAKMTPDSPSHLNCFRILTIFSFKICVYSNKQAPALFNSLMESGDDIKPPKISETARLMAMKILPNVKLNEEARNQKKIDII